MRFASKTPAYVLGDDAQDRVTRAPRPLADELAASRQVLESDWFDRLAMRDRQLVATKFVRAHLLPGLALRSTREASDESVAAACADADRFLAVAARHAPGFERSLSVADDRVTSLIRSEPGSPRLRSALAGWSRVRSLTPPFTPRVLDQLRVDAPIRWAVATLLLPLRMRHAERRAG